MPRTPLRFDCRRRQMDASRRRDGGTTDGRPGPASRTGLLDARTPVALKPTVVLDVCVSAAVIGKLLQEAVPRETEHLRGISVVSRFS